ncbi:GNAT family N-acetyltransferase [Ostreiculturibacter nitratireducens]|uniref:GNAT family N-acetyltransferase n=1 Tax=Ostreiculturibacter nitratireducens TaxID=3075226 RepID=UPI0031B5A23E
MSFAIRPLEPRADRDLVNDLFRRSADYVRLERGEEPGETLADEFFDDAPPGADPAKSLKFGLFLSDGTLAGIADVGFDFPEPGDAFLGLLQLATDARDQGLGAAFLRHIEAAAKDRGAPRLFIAVLDENPRGRAFWDREGFAVALANSRVRLGSKEHVATRMVKPL